MRSALGRSLDAVIFAAFVAVVDGDPPAWPGPCPCANPRWCKPLSPQPAPRPEVVAYHGSRSNTNSTGRGALPAWSATGVPPANNGNWSSFDWSKVTTIGLFAPLEGPDGWDLLCTAHQHNVRVLPWAAAAFGRPSPIALPYVLERAAEAGEGGHRRGEASGVFTNHTALSENAKASAEFVAAAGLDGILLDAESLRNATIRDGLTFWVGNLRAELNLTVPGGLLTWTTSPNAADWYNETWEHPERDYRQNLAYDYAAIAPFVDFFQPMLYCNSGAQPMPHRGPYRFIYSSRSNSPLYMIKMSMDSYVALGIPRSKIVMLLAWFGSDFLCANAECSSVLPNTGTGTQGGCGQAVDGGPSYSQAMAILHNRTELGNSTAAASIWDEDTATSYFRWVNSSDEKLHELWYETPESFSKKCAEVKRVGGRGIGIWLPENANTPTEVDEMWGVIPAFGNPGDEKTMSTTVSD